MQQGDKPLALLAQAREGAALAMQHDGNLVLYENPDKPDWRYVWSTRTKGLDVRELSLQDDGDLVLLGPSGVVCLVFSSSRGGSDEPCPTQVWAPQ